MTDITGDLTVTVVKGSKLQNLSVFGACNPYVIVKVKSSSDMKTTSVKDGETNPLWQETFTFRNVSTSTSLQMSLMEKQATSEGVVSVSKPIHPLSWGYPGIGGAERVLDVSMPASTDRASPDGTLMASMGTVRLCLRYRALLSYRAFIPLSLLRIAAAKTGVVTEKLKIDMVVEKMMNIIYTPVCVAGNLNRTQQLAAGGVAAIAGGGVTVGVMVLSVPVIVMSLLFLPLTLMGGFFAVVVAVMLLPVILTAGWVLICCRPVQCRVWQPLLFAAVVKVPIINKILLTPPSNGKEQ